jgi:hypothetical protein
MLLWKVPKNANWEEGLDPKPQVLPKGKLLQDSVLLHPLMSNLPMKE